MRIAYLITAYGDFEHLERLITVLLNDNVTIIVHIDAKCGTAIQHQLEMTFPGNVHFVRDRFLVTWGGFNLTLAFISLMEECRQKGHFDYVFMLSGSDFPIVSHESIVIFLSKNRGKEFLEYHKMPFSGWSNSDGGLDRFRLEWPIDEMGLEAAEAYAEALKLKGFKREFPAVLEPYGGSCWWTISFDLLSYICEYVTKNFDWIYGYFKNVLLADEILMHSIILSSPFKRKVVNNNLRYIDWNSGPEYPRTLRADDLISIKESKRLFARKFDSKTDRTVIDSLEMNLNKAKTIKAF